MGERGPWLEVADGAVWRIDTREDVHGFEGQPVQLEAWQRGAGLLELLWIGPVPV